ncbi:MAG: GIY-YIG nuclease family protein [Mollicutes bacterium PWAP]|nr:GIY-YIG nuclease family protein [Mollicutes bacterium PWAP]
MELKDLDNTPKKPGVYIWKNEYGLPIYIGKAKNLYNRTRQYLKGQEHSYKIGKMISNVVKMDYIVTNNDKEALILERNLIEKNKPIYNILLTDDKRYPYLKIKLSKSNNLEIKFQFRKIKKEKNTFFFGPFPTGYGAKNLRNILERIYLFEKGMPIKNKNYQYWLEKFNELKKIFTSRKSFFTKFIIDKMNIASEKYNYELANEYKNALYSIGYYDNNQAIEVNIEEDVDVLGFYIKDEFILLTIMFYRSGMMLSKYDYIFEMGNDVETSIDEIVHGLYKIEEKTKIYSNYKFEFINSFVPKIGFKKKMVELAIKNSSQEFDKKTLSYKQKRAINIDGLKDLQKMLYGIDVSDIAMMDNSNTSNTNPVSVVIRYQNGFKNFNKYRKYNLEVGSRKSDVDYMRQGVIKFLRSEKKDLPSLFIVDGGIQQINEVYEMLLNVNVKVVGLVKDKNHNTDRLISYTGEDFKLDKKSNLYKFMSQMQIEVDNYAKRKHRSRNLSSIEGSLSSIEGIGPKLESKILNHFKNYQAIWNANLEELLKVTSKSIAKRIMEKFKK